MRLVRNWRRFWRWYSTWATGLGAAAGAAWLVVPQEMRSQVPDQWLGAFGAALFVLVLVARLIDQGESE
jgi:hypothetical protein